MRPIKRPRRDRRTFQNNALFKGMSVLDNVLTGRNLKRRSSWLEQALRGPGAP
jgi:branched-chain amino acid transport system ATP-binding protein